MLNKYNLLCSNSTFSLVPCPPGHKLITAHWLFKSLYGLRQAPLKWFKTINTHLCTNDFKPINTDPCIYTHHQKGLTSYITLYINNCTIITHQSQTHKIKDMIKSRFPIKDLSNTKSILSF